MFNFFSKKNDKSYQELKESEKMFRTLLDTIPFCVKWFDKNGQLVSINRGGRKEHFLEGKTEEEIRNWHYFDCIEEKYHQKVKDLIKLALGGTASSFEMEHVPGTSLGHWCASTLEPVKNEKGETEYVLFLSRDITDEKAKEQDQKEYFRKIEETKDALYNILEDSKVSEKKAQKESERSQAIISSMGEGLIMIDKNYNIVLLNKKAEDLLGVSASNMIGKDLRKLQAIIEKNVVINEKDLPIVKVIETGQAIYANMKNDIYYQSSSGKNFPVGFAITPLKEDGITGAVIIFWDLTEEKNLDKAKSNFISIASHQLRTPLTSLRWISELFLSGDVGALTGKQLNFMEDIHKGSIRLLDLIGALLSISRIEAGRVSVEPVPTSISDITLEILQQVKPLSDGKKLAIEFKSISDAPKINLVVEFLRQVILNLISNAINYTPQGGQINISVKTQLFDGKEYALFSIADTGIGIPQDDQKKIFEKFYRADNAVAITPGGTGLGLNLVRLIVTMWNGKIWFESEAGKGTTFFFTVPLSGMQSQKGEVKLFV